MTCYVVNEQRTKFLLHYDDWSRRWLPTDCPIKDDEPPKRVVTRYVLDTAGIEARHIVEYSWSTLATPTHILEADESAISESKLQEHFGAQWLTRDEILSSDSIHETTKDFADLLLA